MNEFFNNFHFLRPAALFLIPVAVLVWWFWQKRSDPLAAWRNQIEPPLLDALATGHESLRKRTKLWLLVGWLVTIFAIAGPTWQPAPSPFAEDTTPLFVLLKSTKSMDQKDISPSRLERARLEIADLVSSVQGQPLGLIAYAGSAHLVVPPTRDAEVVRQMADEISAEIMPSEGDRLDLALREAYRVLQSSGTNGSVVILADSIDTDASLLEEAIKATKLPIQILAIAIPDSSEASSLSEAAHTLKASIQPLRIDTSDTDSIVERAAGIPVFQSGEEENSWQEVGYYLIPFLAALALLTFRQESSAEEVSS